MNNRWPAEKVFVAQSDRQSSFLELSYMKNGVSIFRTYMKNINANNLHIHIPKR